MITIGFLHAYLFENIEIKKTPILEKNTNIKTIIKLTKVVIQIPPEIEKITLPQPPKVVVKPIIKPIIKKNAIKKMIKKKEVKKKKVVKKKKIYKKKQNRVKNKIMPKNTNKIKNKYLSKVKRLINQKKRYPKGAKRLGQEGIVKIKFTILASGKIINIMIVKKSKFSKLNKAGVKLLTKIGVFDKIPKELGESKITITVPIKYQILN